MTTFNLIVIGSGPAGCRAAIKASKQGLKTLLVESGFYGGTCVNVGCLPTKYLLSVTALAPSFNEQARSGQLSGKLNFNLAKLQEDKSTYLKLQRDAVEQKLRNAGVTLVKGKAVFKDSETIIVKSDSFKFEKCIIATGSAPASFPGLTPDGKAVLTATALANLTSVPKNLLIVGGGVIALEMGTLFARLGSHITIVEASPRIAATEDQEISAELHKFLESKNWKIMTGKKVSSVETVDDEAVLTFDDGSKLQAQKALIAVGRKPSANTIVCENAGVKTFGPGWIETNEFLQATPNIYVVGDINKKLMLANAGEHQADYVIDHICNTVTGPYNQRNIPSSIYGDVEVMHVGPDAETLKKSGCSVEVSYGYFKNNPLAVAYGLTHGLVKIAWVDQMVASIAAWGHGASQLSTSSAIIVEQKWNKNNATMVYPTLDTVLKEALEAKTNIA